MQTQATVTYVFTNFFPGYRDKFSFMNRTCPKKIPDTTVHISDNRPRPSINEE